MKVIDEFTRQKGQLWFCPNCEESWSVGDAVAFDFPYAMTALEDALMEHLKTRRDCALIVFDAT